MTLGIATLAAYIAPRLYEASATVYLARNLPAMAATSATGNRIILDRRELIDSEVELMTSRPVFERVADEMPESSHRSASRAAPRSFASSGPRRRD